MFSKSKEIGYGVPTRGPPDESLWHQPIVNDVEGFPYSSHEIEVAVASIVV